MSGGTILHTESSPGWGGQEVRNLTEARWLQDLGWRVLELSVWGALSLGLGFGLEARLGQLHPQSWEFFAAFACLYLTFAFPGFVWRYLRRGRHAQGA